MKHLGDITKINGAEIEPVWAIIGGSPCQDLSVAGKRAGLAGARSGLFMEQIRVIKEMRQHERDTGRANDMVRPRYMVWENVPGAFSSNKGEDFRAVLEETARIADGNADVPQPPNGKWANAGCIMGNGWSIAWRVHDAQFWGVPQRRRRISLVADFGGQSAPEILFERKGVSGDIAESGTAGEGTAGDVENGVGAAIGVKCLNPSFQQSARVYDADGVWHSLNANENGGQSRDAVLYEPKSAYEENWAKSDVKNALRAEASKSSHAICIQGDIARGAHFGQNGIGCSTEDVSYTLNTMDVHAVFDAREPITYPGVGITSKANASNPKPGDPCHTLNTDSRNYVVTGDHQNRVTDYTAICIGNGQTNQSMDDKAGALNCMHDQKSIEIPVYCSTDDYLAEASEEVPNTLKVVSYKSPPYCNIGYAVRRLTPLECERLQGYPEIMEMNLEAMTKDEYIACNLASGQIIANCETGEVYTAKGPGGIALSNPRKLDGTNNNGYLVVNIRNGDTKLQCRIHRIIWISAHGIIPDGYVIDHINSIKTDNRLCNLQLITCAENSYKAKADGLYLMGADNPSTKITQSEKTEIVYLYSSGLFTMRQLSEEYGISKSRIQQIVKTYGWTDIPGASDSARYKALGNSIALPFWRWMLKRMSAYLPEGATLGSLFDGIGGYPLIWEEIHGKGTARWASEIEPFPIRVTEYHFGRAYE